MSVSGDGNKGDHSKQRRKFEVILNGLISMLNLQRSQIDVLLEDRDSAAGGYQILHRRWVSDLRLCRDRVSLLQRQLSLSELSKSVEKAKADLLLDLKEREALISRRKLENLQNELDDLKTLCEIRSHGCPGQQDISPDKLYASLKTEGMKEKSSHGSSTHWYGEIEEELTRLKYENENLSVQYTCSLSALESERNFVWNQLKELESIYIDQLEIKKNEVDEAKEEIKKLLVLIEQLHSSMGEKDELIRMLRANIIELESEANQKDAETLSSARLPVFKRCSSKPSASGSTVRKNYRKRKSGVSQEEAYSKRQKNDEVIKLGSESIDSVQKTAESSTISEEIQSSRLKIDYDAPVLKHCKGEVSSNSRGKGTRRTKRSTMCP